MVSNLGKPYAAGGHTLVGGDVVIDLRAKDSDGNEYKMVDGTWKRVITTAGEPTENANPPQRSKE